MAQHTLIITSEKESPSISTPGSVDAGKKPVNFSFNDDKMTQPIPRGVSDQEGADTMQAYNKWSKYRKELPELVATGEKNQLWIESALNDYRLSIIELAYKLESVIPKYGRFIVKSKKNCRGCLLENHRPTRNHS